MKIETIKKKGFAISLIAFPVMLFTGLLMHPDLLKIEALKTVEQLVGRFKNQPLLPIGAAIQALGLMKEKFVSKWQGMCIVVGLLPLNNPDIELISATGALLMCAGYIPCGVKILQGRMKCSSLACPIYDRIKENNFKCLKPCG